MKTITQRLIAVSAIVMVLACAAFTQTTPNLGLNVPATGTTGWDILLNQNFSKLDTAVVAPCIASGVAYVGGSAGYVACWGSSDIGAQINAAYAALPTTGGIIYVVPKSDNSCYAFTTSISATTAGKYLLLKGLMAAGSSAGCLNYTPTTGSAITLDFVPTTGAGARAGVFGLRDLWLTNNLCTAIGGCGGSTTGVSVTNTNDGIDGGMMENVTIQGFTAGYTENARVPVSAVQWINPHIFNNTAGMILYSTAEEQIVGGTFYGNSVHIQSGDTTSHPEIHITGTYFVAHGVEAFDFTRNSVNGSIYLSDVHLENGANVSSNAHYVEGAVDIFGKGGIAEDDSSSGTADWWFKPAGGAFMWDALEMVTASRNPTTGVLNLAGNTRTKLTGFVINPATLTAITGGANASKATVCLLSGDLTNTASTCSMEAPLQVPSVSAVEGSAPTAASGKDICYGDSSAHALKCSYNNGSFLSTPQVVASGTSALGTSAISATTCATAVTTAATGAATTDSIEWAFNAAPSTAYTSGVHVLPYVTSGNVNFLVCNPTAGSLTPAAATLNWRVIR